MEISCSQATASNRYQCNSLNKKDTLNQIPSIHHLIARVKRSPCQRASPVVFSRMRPDSVFMLKNTTVRCVVSNVRELNFSPIPVESSVASRRELPEPYREKFGASRCRLLTIVGRLFGATRHYPTDA
jgi:hypothetical protein